ncbi:MAG: tyrosine-type recombinase/integrase [OCS116 cluster bacterium]|nr:tyrosine-type recombinase/integrase [OCS116 cluster bacterium]
MKKEKQYLILRNEIWWYQREIPKHLQDQLGKKRQRMSLKTTDIATAMARRDIIATADDELWSDLKSGVNRDSVRANYDRVIARAKGMNIQYKPSDELIDSFDIDAVMQRIEMLEGNVVRSRVATSAVLGLAEEPLHAMSEILKIYTDDIMATTIMNKNKAQRHRWETGHKRIIDTFIAVCGDLPITQISRDDTLKYQEHFRRRVMDLKGKCLSVGAANREIGTMLTIYKRYHKHFGFYRLTNPFSDLKFAGDRYTPRPPFSVEWIGGLLKAPKALAGLNLPARMITLAMVETGMRPIEICNILPDNIFIDCDVPYVSVEGRVVTADADGFETKSESSVRKIPLLGVSLAAFALIKKQGIGQYFGEADRYSAAANKYLRDKELMESAKHSVYSFRHSFKDRMIEAGIDDEMRDMLMGHSDPKDRPRYGERGSIEFRAKLLAGMALEFDAGLFDAV